jgi:SAM-dependent methyltransferase
MAKIKVLPEYSAQPSVARATPLLEVSIKHIISNENTTELNSLRVADYGCGKLRHLCILRNYFNSIYLVDTKFQLSRTVKLFGEKTTITKYIATLETSNNIRILNGSEFESSELGLNAIFSIAVLDVVLPSTRTTMIETVHKNLKPGGFFVIIIPRNDSSILKRCLQNNKYYDGYFFNHHGITTFFKNFREAEHLVNKIARSGFVLVKNLSIYRHVCLLFKKK